jgi:hypothetical protein
MDIPTEFLPGFKGIRQFNSLWKEAEASEQSGPQLAALFTCQSCPLSEKNLQIILKGTFTRYCYFYLYKKVQLLLNEEILRIQVETHCAGFINDFVKNICSKGKISKNAEDPEGCISTLMLLLSEKVFKAYLSEFDFQCLLRLPFITVDVVKRIIEISEEGTFDISSQTQILIHDLQKQNPENMTLKEIGVWVNAAYERRVGRLMQDGLFENTNVIMDRLNCLTSFPTPFHRSSYGSGVYPYTAVEMVFNSISGIIRRKSNWRAKCCNAEIVQKWRDELINQIPDGRIFELVVEHLCALKEIGRDHHFEVSPVEKVFQSDSIVTPEIRNDLKRLVGILERSNPIDFHPGSNDTVVDIVHPSLYPAVAGLSRVRSRPTCSLMKSYFQDLGSLGLPTLSFKENRSKEYGWSKEYCWLPAEFHVNKSGGVTVNSYINNLHPVLHHELYGVIAQIFAAAVPVVEQALSTIVINPKKVLPLRLIPAPEKHVMYDPTEYEKLDFNDDEVMEEYYDNRVPLSFPLPDHFPLGSFEHYAKPKVSLRDKHLQVIVKIASIELTPDKPVYEGGTWHVEGMRNEDIVCSVIHYYSCENITESKLEFRQEVCEPMYEQNDHRGPEVLYHMRDEDPLNQHLGHVVAEEGRTIVFPNTLQHCVSRFELKDHSLPGHRKILVYFLVNPLSPITSTASIPPQQRDWVAFESDSHLHHVLHYFALPDDVVALVYEYLDYPLSRHDAEVIRERLMHERSYFVDALTAETFERPFSLCEH